MSRESDIQIGIAIGKLKDLELVDTALWFFAVPYGDLDDPIDTALKKEIVSRGVLSRSETEVAAKATKLKMREELLG